MTDEPNYRVDVLLKCIYIPNKEWYIRRLIFLLQCNHKPLLSLYRSMNNKNKTRMITTITDKCNKKNVFKNI